MLTANLALDIDSRRGVTLSGSTVTTIADVNPNSAGNGVYSFTGSGSTTATYTAQNANANGQPSLNFASASSQQMVSAQTVTLATPYTLYFVGQESTLATAPIGWTVYGTHTTELPYNSSTQWGARAGSVSGHVVGGTSDTSLHMYALSVPTTGTGYLYVDSSSAPVASWTSGSGDSLSGTMWLGSADGSYYWNGAIYKVAIYSVAHSPLQVHQMFAYGANQYGILAAANDNAAEDTRLALIDGPIIGWPYAANDTLRMAGGL